MNKIFIPPFIISVALLVGVYFWSGTIALFLTMILSVLEITLSFDNAVINAKILSKMSAKWQSRFLTWGMFIAVFGTRVLLPVLIVSTALWKSPVIISYLAVYNATEYGRLLASVRPAIATFGGSFLLMVSLKYFFDEVKDIHWIEVIEKKLSLLGKMEAIEIALVLSTLLFLGFLLPTLAAIILTSGSIGIILFVLVEGLANVFTKEVGRVASGGVALFLYLNVIDSAFSLDGVVGAFALTTSLIVIAVGLGIGALFVRTLTLQLVRQKTLDQLVYLEHGAHWAIFGLAVSMFIGLIIHVPEVIIGSIGIFFILASYFSSKRLLKATLLASK
jgi:hypothetical protein